MTEVELTASKVLIKLGRKRYLVSANIVGRCDYFSTIFVASSMLTRNIPTIVRDG